MLLGLSDGMGSGSSARKESEMVLDLVERFLEAGFSMETAIRMMNSAMVMKGEKLTSTQTLPLHGEPVQRYGTPVQRWERRLPLSGGRMRWSALHRKICRWGRVRTWMQNRGRSSLNDGDFIVMVTDGV